MTAPLVVKIAEVYHISKREAVHTQMLKLRHTTQRGGSMVNLKETDPGTSPQLVCSDCSAPWGKLSKCLLCQGSQPVDLSVTPLSVIEVAGQSWQLRLTEAGPTWVPTDSKVTKAAGLWKWAIWADLPLRQLRAPVWGWSAFRSKCLPPSA